jgi:hypothetical protein
VLASDARCWPLTPGAGAHQVAAQEYCAKQSILAIKLLIFCLAVGANRSNNWRRTKGNQMFYFILTLLLPACPTEDSTLCQWDSQTGQSFVALHDNWIVSQ